MLFDVNAWALLQFFEIWKPSVTKWMRQEKVALLKDSLLLKQQFCNILLQCSYAKCAVQYLLYLKKEEFCHLFSAVCGVGFLFLVGLWYYVTPFVILISLMYYHHWFCYSPPLTMTSWYWFPAWLSRGTESCFPESFGYRPLRKPQWVPYEQGRIHHTSSGLSPFSILASKIPLRTGFINLF